MTKSESQRKNEWKAQTDQFGKSTIRVLKMAAAFLREMPPRVRLSARGKTEKGPPRNRRSAAAPEGCNRLFD